MTIAAIYCRVSTHNQEAEGTSLQTQLEAWRGYCPRAATELVAEAEYQVVLWRDLINTESRKTQAKGIDILQA